MALVSAKSIEIPKSIDMMMKKQTSLLNVHPSSDCDGSDMSTMEEDNEKCFKKMPSECMTGPCKCMKVEGTSYSLSCADAGCKEFFQCLIKAACKAMKTSKNPKGCAEAAFQYFDKDCDAKCDDPMMLIIIIVVVLILVGVGVFCYCRRKNAAAKGAAVQKN